MSTKAHPIKRPGTLRHVGPDFAVLAVILASLNAVIARGDLGWLALNPTPFLLIPLLLGVRYGFNAGVLSGFITAGLIVATRALVLDGSSMVDIAFDHRFALAALPFAGALIGQLSESIKNRTQELADDNELLHDQTKLLRAEREVLTLSKQDLQQRLGLYGAESASLDEDLQILVQSSPEAGPQTLLNILKRVTNLRSAAIYSAPTNTNPGTYFAQAAAIGEDAHFPEVIVPREHHVAHAALSKNTLMTQRGLLEDTPTREPGYLLAAPLTGANGTFLLVVQDLPFAEINMRTFTAIRSICRWFEVTVLNPIPIPAGHKALDQEKFYNALENAISTHATQSLPSTLVRIPFDAPADTPAFNRFLAELPHSSLVTNTVDHGRRSILFLFPVLADTELRNKFRTAFNNFTGQIGLEDVEAPTFHITNPDDSPQQLWGKLVGAPLINS